jgi:hypothetical protein
MHWAMQDDNESEQNFISVAMQSIAWVLSLLGMAIALM